MPAVKEELGATDGQLGVALFLATAGLVLAQPLAGLIVGRRGGFTAAVAGIAPLWRWAATGRGGALRRHLAGAAVTAALAAA